jgi:hypothetical protein
MILLGLLWGDFDQLVELELGCTHGVAVDGVVCADLFKDVVAVDERVAYVKATEVGADCVHDDSFITFGYIERIGQIKQHRKSHALTASGRLCTKCIK